MQQGSDTAVMYRQGGKFVCMYEGGVPMAYYVLENDCLKVTAADMGAELASIYDKEKQRSIQGCGQYHQERL